MSKDVGKQIKQLRLEKNLSQERFGRKIGLTDKTISAYETGKIIPPLEVLQKISVSYKVRLETPDVRTKEDILAKIEIMRDQLDFISQCLKGYNTL